MATIYIDNDYKCHTEPAAGLTEIETDVFDGKCRAYIEGYRFVPAGETWVRDDGVVFTGEMIAPHTDSRILQAYQRGYEESKEGEADV